MTIQKVYKTKNIIKVSLEDTLSHIFSLFSSSHDSAFVFDESDVFVGLVNPYYCMILKSYPANTKVKHCLMRPPRIDINSSLRKAARTIIDSRIYYLPVFLHDVFAGIISAKRLLNTVKNESDFHVSVGSFLKHTTPLVSLFPHDFLSKALMLFKKHRISKLAVVTQDLKLAGVIGYFDLISYMIVPREKQHFSSREGVKIPFLRRLVTTIMKTNVVTVNKNELLSKVVSLILQREVGSVVVVDHDRHPIGLVTIRDLLSVYVGRKPLFHVEVMTKNLSKHSYQAVSVFITHLNNHFSRVRNFSKARIFIKENPTKHLFRAGLLLFSKNKTVKVIKNQGKNLLNVLSELKKKSKNT